MLILVSAIILCLSLWGVRQLTLEEKVPFGGAFFLMLVTIVCGNLLEEGLFTIGSVMTLAFISVLMVIAIVDYYTKTIADITLYVLFGITLFTVIFTRTSQWETHLYGALWGGAFYGTIYVLAKVIYKREAFGFGDVLLMIGIGGYFSFFQSVLISFLAFYVGLIILLIGKLLGQKKTLEDEIPFGPFMIIATLIMLFYGGTLMSFCNQLFI